MDNMEIVQMDVALRALVGMKWRNPENKDLHHYQFECGGGRNLYEVTRLLSGWGAKMTIRANDILIYEAHIVPRRGASDNALINAWDLMVDKMFLAKEVRIKAVRDMAYEDLSDWVNSHEPEGK